MAILRAPGLVKLDKAAVAQHDARPPARARERCEVVDIEEGGDADQHFIGEREFVAHERGKKW